MGYARNNLLHRALQMRASGVEGETAANEAWINLLYKDSFGYQETARSDRERKRILR
jgi:hypothetical protein